MDGKKVVKAASHRGKGIAVFTSGGDSQGKINQSQVFFLPLDIILHLITSYI